MNFQELHELLRLELLSRIELGSLTGTELARQTGFQQAHISNFLNKKRALSMEGLDRVLEAQKLTIDQIMPLEFSAAAVARPTDDPIDVVPVVSSSTAMDEAQIRSGSIIESIHVSASRLRDNRPRPSAKCASWQRFVAIRADEQQTAAMGPMILPGAIAVLDRHYNSLAPYHAHQRTLFAVRHGASLVLRYVEFDDGRLILRPLSLSFPVQLLTLGQFETPSDYIVGRVCQIISEL